MTTLIYEASIPIWKSFLDNLSIQLNKAVVYADAKKIEHSVILNARLYPNMLSLMKQVQMATDQAKNAASHLAGLKVRKFENTEINFSELQARISKTISFLETITLQQLEGSEKRDIVIFMRDTKIEMKGMQYLMLIAHPAFLFYITSAYNILRHSGVEIDGEDQLGQFEFKQ